MSGRPVQTKADIPALRKVLQTSDIVDYQPLIVYIMRCSGCTFSEIAKVFELTRQHILTLYKNAEDSLE